MMIIWGGTRMMIIWGGTRMMNIWGGTRMMIIWGGTRMMIIWGGARMMIIWGGARMMIIWGGARMIIIWGGDRPQGDVTTFLYFSRYKIVNEQKGIDFLRASIFKYVGPSICSYSLYLSPQYYKNFGCKNMD